MFVSRTHSTSNDSTQLTENNAANAEEIAAASQQLSSEAFALNDIVSSLGEIVGGNAAIENGNGNGAKVLGRHPQALAPLFTQAANGGASRKLNAAALNHENFGHGFQSLKAKILSDEELNGAAVETWLGGADREKDFRDIN